MSGKKRIFEIFLKENIFVVKLTMIHKEESKSDIVKDQVHPIAEADGFLHRFPVEIAFKLGYNEQAIEGP